MVVVIDNNNVHRDIIKHACGVIKKNSDKELFRRKRCLKGQMTRRRKVLDNVYNDNDNNEYT